MLVSGQAQEDLGIPRKATPRGSLSQLLPQAPPLPPLGAPSLSACPSCGSNGDRHEDDFSVSCDPLSPAGKPGPVPGLAAQWKWGQTSFSSSAGGLDLCCPIWWPLATRGYFKLNYLKIKFTVFWQCATMRLIFSAPLWLKTM